MLADVTLAFCIDLVLTCRHGMRFQPQRPRGHGRINSRAPPPCGFIAEAMGLAMVTSTQWHGELVADLAPECPALREAKMVSIGRLPPANQTRMLGDKLDVIPVTNPPRLRQCQHALVDHLRPTVLRPSCLLIMR